MAELFSKNIQLLEKMLDYTALRQRTIAHNIANVNTPGFRQSDVEFDGELKKALESRKGLSRLQPEVYKPDIAPKRSDGNNVDIDAEIGKLAENALRYRIYAHLISRRLRGIKDAIKSAAQV